MLRASLSIDQYKTSNVVIWMLMAAQGGFLNVGGWLACRRFVSHVTGYASQLPMDWSSSDPRAFGMALAIPAFFLLGAGLSGYFVEVRRWMFGMPGYFYSFAAMAGILLVICVVGEAGGFGPFAGLADTVENETLALALALTCGIQNGVITTVSRAVIRTTHLSGLVTDLGLGLTRAVGRWRSPEQFPPQGRANGMRLGIIFCFVFGSALGYAIYPRIGFLGFGVPMLCSSALCVTMRAFSRRGEAPPRD